MPTSRIAFPLAVLAAVVSSLVVGAGAASGAKEKQPPKCYKLVLTDEYDGQIDGTYPLHCYREAIAHLSGDALIYGQFKNDLTRAMLDAIASLKRKGIRVGPNTKLPAERTSERSFQEHHRKKGFFAAIADKIGPGNASSIPLPLLILAGLGLLLVAAAGASYTARWIAARRAQPAPATSPPTPRRE